MNGIIFASSKKEKEIHFLADKLDGGKLDQKKSKLLGITN